MSHPLVTLWHWTYNVLHHPRGQKPGGGTFWAWKFKITMHWWTGSGGEIFCSTPGITFGVPALIPATTFLPHPGNINAPLPEGFYKHQCWCILQALGPGNIVVFYYPLLCHRQYMACGHCVHSSVNNSTLGRCARSPLGWSHMEHCQHQLLGPIQYIIIKGAGRGGH